MSWTIYNRGLQVIVAQAHPVDLRGLILAGSSVPGGAIGVDLNFVSELLAVGSVVEAAASGYARVDLASVAVTEDDTADLVTITWTAPSWTDVAVGETWRAFVLYVEGASDAARPLVGIDSFGTPLPTNGSDISYTGASLQVTRG